MTKRVFIVDDEETMIEALQEMLRRGGFEVAGAAHDGDEAIRSYAAISPPPDVVIMDFRLPVKNGIEVMAEILKVDPRARVLFVSADMTARRPAIEAGAAGFFVKPFGMAELMAKIRALADIEKP
jgi:two-component system chemotaxis response regulator CheY